MKKHINQILHNHKHTLHQQWIPLISWKNRLLYYYTIIAIVLQLMFCIKARVGDFGENSR